MLPIMVDFLLATAMSGTGRRTNVPTSSVISRSPPARRALLQQRRDRDDVATMRGLRLGGCGARCRFQKCSMASFKCRTSKTIKNQVPDPRNVISPLFISPACTLSCATQPHVVPARRQLDLLPFDVTRPGCACVPQLRAGTDSNSCNSPCSCSAGALFGRPER